MQPWKENALIRTRNLLWAIFIFASAAAIAASAQGPDGSPKDNSVIDRTISGPGISSLPDNLVDEVRVHKSWGFGPFANGGSGVGERSDFKFFSVGFELGKRITPVLHAGIFSGQLELAGNIMPLWQAYTPAAHQQTYQCVSPGGQPIECFLPVAGGTFTGASLTPVIFRWHFATRSRRWEPWFQAAGGLIYTTHKFPPDVLIPHGTPGGTSVWNISPQGGGGIHYFPRPRRSIDLGINGVHISSASLGDRNPGVNASIQVQVGYTWWK